ncbi:MAG: Bacillibactin exporter [Burkholderiaceae bacterium]|nr:Bacillibactin exporter [Burkholderiaceae bacterium]
MSPQSLVFTACAFASGFALRAVDPLIVPIAQRFDVAPATAALLTSAYALPYALAQPFLGPLGDRFGKLRCMQVCVVGLALMLVAGAAAPNFGSLMASRLLGGVFAGGLIPLVLAGLGDAYDLHERQVMVGRMLVAIISGQMLGSAAAGLVGDAAGWRAALALAAAIAVVAAVSAWIGAAHDARPATASATSFAALYARVFDNRKAFWLYGAVVAEGTLVFAPFPYIGQLLIERAGSTPADAPARAGLVLAAFGIGGIVYGLLVRRLVAALGVRRMCALGSAVLAAGYAAFAALPLWWLFALAMAACGMGYYMLHNALQIEATELAPAARGSAVALFACGFFVGQALGPPLFGALMHAAGFGAALLASAFGIVVLGRVVVRAVVVAAPAGALPT